MTAALQFEALHRSGEELMARASRLAGGLYALGLREGDVVAVLLRNCEQFVGIVHAARVAGIYYCPINWHFTAAEVGFLLQDSGAKALVAHGDLLDAAAAALPTGLPLLAVGPSRQSAAIDYEAWLARSADYAGPAVAPRGHMAYTSGTTGKPKGVLRAPIPLAQLAERQAQILRVVEATFGIRPGCRALLPAPLYHSAPGVFVQNGLQYAELFVLLPRFDPEAVLAAIATYRIDVAYLVPIMFVRLLRLPAEVRARYDLSSLRFIGSTGAPCPPEVKRALIEWLGPVVHETYASSEAGMITAIDSHEALAHPGSAGRPVEGAQIRILDEAGRDCLVRTPGLIYVRQPAYPDFTYRGNDEARRAIERDGLISLGDIGYLDEQGYLYVCDRASDMVISGGVNIYPAEIENELMRYPGVADCAVFGVPDAEYGERLHAVVEPAAGETLTPEALIGWLRQHLSGFKVPRSIAIATLPRDDNGKIAKRRLREAHWVGQSRRV
ncbi:MAG: long-chain fatty acid--CoA ligase [Burkholderiaceae bacterium]|nr:MAG: long-chain fatty acid--CoA ligase [Burkholderiaceae bacterium]